MGFPRAALGTPCARGSQVRPWVRTTWGERRVISKRRQVIPHSKTTSESDKNSRTKGAPCRSSCRRTCGQGHCTTRHSSHPKEDTRGSAKLSRRPPLKTERTPASRRGREVVGHLSPPKRTPASSRGERWPADDLESASRLSRRACVFSRLGASTLVPQGGGLSWRSKAGQDQWPAPLRVSHQ